MFYQLTSAVKRRLISELRRYWSSHPKYRDIADNIQGSYSFKDRPQYGFVVRTGGGNQFTMAADNFIGTGHSYLTLAGVGTYPGIAIEWVVEDAAAIAANGGTFPSLPGIYYIELTGDDEFIVGPMLEHRGEAVSFVSDLGVLANAPVQGSVRLYEQPNGFELVEGTNYTVDYSNGAVTLLLPLPAKNWVAATYRSNGAITGPHKYYPNRSNHTAIPGAVLAFGTRTEKGDRMAVHVQPRRSPAYLEFGGRWDLSFDIDIIARDVHTQEELTDQTVIFLWGVARSQMSAEGLEMLDLNIGGTSEEIYDENADDYFFNNSLSLTIQTEWNIRQPLTVQLLRASDVTTDMAVALGEDASAAITTGIAVTDTLGIRYLGDPYFSGRTRTFEVIR